MDTTEPRYEYQEPNWAPLFKILPPGQAELFMWMHTVVYDGGLRLEAYKHVITRQYLYLDADGRGWRPAEDAPLHPLDPREPLEEIYRHLDELGWSRDITAEGYAAVLEATSPETPGARSERPRSRPRRCPRR